MSKRRGLTSLTHVGGEPVVERVHWENGERVVTRRLTGEDARRWVRRRDQIERVAGIILLPIAIPYAWWYNRPPKKGDTP